MADKGRAARAEIGAASGALGRPLAGLQMRSKTLFMSTDWMGRATPCRRALGAARGGGRRRMRVGPRGRYSRLVAAYGPRRSAMAARRGRGAGRTLDRGRTGGYTIHDRGELIPNQTHCCQVAASQWVGRSNTRRHLSGGAGRQAPNRTTGRGPLGGTSAGRRVPRRQQAVGPCGAPFPAPAGSAGGSGAGRAPARGLRLIATRAHPTGWSSQGPRRRPASDARNKRAVREPHLAWQHWGT